MFFFFQTLQCSRSARRILSAEHLRSGAKFFFLLLFSGQKTRRSQSAFLSEEKRGGATARRVQLRCGMKRKLPPQPPACNPCRRRCCSSEEEQRTKRVLIQELDRTRACPLCGLAASESRKNCNRPRVEQQKRRAARVFKNPFVF